LKFARKAFGKLAQISEKGKKFKSKALIALGILIAALYPTR
jgi:hypothetical protein